MGLACRPKSEAKDEAATVAYWRKRDKDCGSLLDSSTWWRDERAENRGG
jgi:hypothetical protein